MCQGTKVEEQIATFDMICNFVMRLPVVGLPFFFPGRRAGEAEGDAKDHLANRESRYV